MTARACFLGTGVFVLAAAVVGLRTASSATEVSGPRAMTVSGPGDVAVVSMVYDPGQSSGWHTHAGIHAVAVLAGTLTVYDGECRPQVVEPGRPYVGGQELHLARNDTAVPVEMIVTYINPSATAGEDARHATGPACDRVTGDARS